jgi:hypothetical protein
MLNVVYTRTIIPTGRQIVKVMAFGSLKTDKLVRLDDCEIEMRDWDYREGIEMNHIYAVHDLLNRVGAPCGYQLTEEETHIVGLRKFKID